MPVSPAKWTTKTCFRLQRPLQKSTGSIKETCDLLGSISLEPTRRRFSHCTWLPSLPLPSWIMHVTKETSSPMTVPISRKNADNTMKMPKGSLSLSSPGSKRQDQPICRAAKSDVTQPTRLRRVVTMVNWRQRTRLHAKQSFFDNLNKDASQW